MNIGKTPRAVETFRMVPDRLWTDDRLQAQDVRLWCCLAFLARGRDHCEATDATLATKLRVSERTVRDSLRRLEQCQFISRQRVGEGRVITLQPEGDGHQLAEFALRIVG